MNLNLTIKTALFVLFAIIIANLVLLDAELFVFREKENTPPNTQTNINVKTGADIKPTPDQPSQAPNNQIAQQPTIVDSCGKECQKIIDEKIAKAIASLPEAKTTTIIQKAETPSTPQTTYIPIGTTFSTRNTDWTEVQGGGVWIDTADYGKNVTVSWDASIKIDQGNGKVFARLFDDSNKIAVSLSELSYNSANYTNVVSGNLPFWRGKNFYKVQIKSLNGGEAFFSSGRIKIVAR